MRFDDECSCDDDTGSNRCANCGTADVSCSIGRDAYCGACFSAEQRAKRARKAARENEQAACVAAALDDRNWTALSGLVK